MPQRLDRMLSEAGEGSRSEMSRLIRAGLVCVNGVRVDRPEYKLEPDACTVTLDGRPVLWKRFRHVMLNKPAGVLSATEDGRTQPRWTCSRPFMQSLGSLRPAVCIRTRRGCCC